MKGNICDNATILSYNTIKYLSRLIYGTLHAKPASPAG